MASTPPSSTMASSFLHGATAITPSQAQQIRAHYVGANYVTPSPSPSALMPPSPLGPASSSIHPVYYEPASMPTPPPYPNFYYPPAGVNGYDNSQSHSQLSSQQQQQQLVVDTPAASSSAGLLTAEEIASRYLGDDHYLANVPLPPYIPLVPDSSSFVPAFPPPPTGPPPPFIPACAPIKREIDEYHQL